MNDAVSVASMLTNWRNAARELETAVGRVVVGQPRAIRLMTIAIFARGHVLLAGDVGVGKTTLLRAVARAIGGAYERVEGTVDMMPGDLLYHTYLADDGRPRVEPSAILAKADELSIFFFNEINRARPQVHSLLLRLMAERSVTAFNKTYEFPYVQVYADRNRVEKEETFELPAAARDRFFMEIPIEAPSDTETRRQLIFDPRFYDTDALLMAIEAPTLDYHTLVAAASTIQKSVHTSETLQAYVLRLWDAIVRPAASGVSLPSIDMERLVQGGASPRGLAYLVRAARVRAWLEGRDMLVLATFVAGWGATVSLAAAPDEIFVTSQDDGSVSAIDAGSDHVLARIPVSVGPAGLTVSWDGREIYVTHPDGTAIDVVDAESRTIAFDRGVSGGDGGCGRYCHAGCETSGIAQGRAAGSATRCLHWRCAAATLLRILQFHAQRDRGELLFLCRSATMRHAGLLGIVRRRARRDEDRDRCRRPQFEMDLRVRRWDALHIVARRGYADHPVWLKTKNDRNLWIEAGVRSNTYRNLEGKCRQTGF